jgi:glycosyltransferase involved in cell wall biosynthesis
VTSTCEVKQAEPIGREPELVSVIIPNYNYAEFVGQAIESALGLDWPAVEVIVVDDGSTDESRAVIGGFGSRIRAIFQSNAGQRAAYNTGFSHSHGRIVLFLDSDDLLDPSLVRRLMQVWRPGISKVQFQMKVIDAAGRATGAVLPQFHVVPTPAQVRRWATRAAAYPTPPGSGNAYSRSFLQQIFPLDGEDRAADSYCLAAAPFLGDVITIAEPLVAYRVHGRNDGALSKLDRPRFARELQRSHARFRYSQAAAKSAGIAVPEAALNRSLSVLPYRLASFKLLPKAHPVAADSAEKIVRDVLSACFVAQGVPIRARATLLAWALSVALSPAAIGERLVLWRFSSAARPERLNRALQLLRVVKRHQPS